MSDPTPTAIDFNVVTPMGRELEYMTESLNSGRTSSAGPFSARAGQMLREIVSARDVLLTTSCTDALEMSALLLDLQPGDTVIVPSFTFTSSALAFARAGARILFCDIETETLGIDPEHLASLLDDSVRAVVVVHYAGVACDIDGVRRALADRPDVAVIEDNAHGLFGTWHGRPLGSLGRMATQSFHATKNVVCGEGGALVVHDEADADRAWVLHEKGTDRRAFLDGIVDKYTWRDTGSSFALSDLLAAYLLAQLEVATEIQAMRRGVYDGYNTALAGRAEQVGLTLPFVPEHCEPAYHLYHVVLPAGVDRSTVIAGLREQGIPTAFHYLTLHDSIAGRRFSARPTQCPRSEDISRRLLRLPFHNHVTAEQVERVSDALIAAVARA